MPDDLLPIRHCVCFAKSFLELRESGAETVEEIAGRFGCTTSCGLCRPYIERMLRTGETAFAAEPEEPPGIL